MKNNVNSNLKMVTNNSTVRQVVAFILVIFLLYFLIELALFNLTVVKTVIIISSLMLTTQGIITLTWMLYAWSSPKSIRDRKPPTSFTSPKYSFTAIVPLRHEEKVLKDTITAINKINYPDYLKEILIVIRHDDDKTIREAQQIVNELNNENIKVMVLVNSYPINKPISLNYGLVQSKNQIVSIFDGEDEPHPDIYDIVNTSLTKSDADVVQCGVQLINHDSTWFSSHNVIEYFLWFKSGLHFFADIGGVGLLGGNTVFFKKEYLESVGGWDEKNLTEDADIGIRLTLAGAKTKIVYGEKYATLEETPADIESFIKQRTRWNQGFMQTFLKKDWSTLSNIKSKILSAYLLLSPITITVFILYIPYGLYVSTVYKLPVVITMISYLPFYIVCAIIIARIVGFWEFAKSYNIKFKISDPVKITLTFFPYLALLVISSLRAVFRMLSGSLAWEKTTHINAHRSVRAL